VPLRLGPIFGRALEQQLGELQAGEGDLRSMADTRRPLLGSGRGPAWATAAAAPR